MGETRQEPFQAQKSTRVFFSRLEGRVTSGHQKQNVCDFFSFCQLLLLGTLAREPAMLMERRQKQLKAQLQGGQQRVLIFSSNFSKIVKGTKKKLSQLEENRLPNYMTPNLWKSFNRADAAIIISKMGYVRLF